MNEDFVGSELARDELAYFEAQFRESNSEFWRRLGGVDLAGKTVLDIGCGHGALAVQAAQQGAVRVVGIDIDKTRIDFARRNVALNFPELASRVSFHEGTLDEIQGQFDIALSKDSFEHIDDLSAMLRSIASRLDENGLLVTGFSPLYYSPFGDHGRYWAGSRKIPWLPAVLPERVLFRVATHRRGETVTSASDVGLNKLTPSLFRAMVESQGWEVLTWATNAGGKRGLAALKALSRVPALERYCTVSIYAQLRKPANTTA